MIFSLLAHWVFIVPENLVFLLYIYGHWTASCYFLLFLHVFIVSRKLSSQTLLSGKWVDVRDALCSHAFESRAAFSTSVHDFAAKGLEIPLFFGLLFIYSLIITRVCDSLHPFSSCRKFQFSRVCSLYGIQGKSCTLCFSSSPNFQ